MSNTTLKFGSNLAISSGENVRIYCQIFSQIFLADSTHAYVEFTDVELAYVENGGRGRGSPRRERARRGGSLFDAAHFERSHLALAF